MKINIVTLGEMFLGATYDLTLLRKSYFQNPNHQEDEHMIFTGIKYSTSDKTFWLYFEHADGLFKGSEYGYKISDVVIADLVEPVKV